MSELLSHVTALKRCEPYNPHSGGSWTGLRLALTYRDHAAITTRVRRE
jgi:hypothetical protein